LDVPAQVVSDAAAVAQEAAFGPEIIAAQRWQNRVIVTNSISRRMMRDPVGLFLGAGARVGRGHVELGALAVDKARELPVLGLFAAKPGEDVTADPLRVALLLAVGMLDPEPPQAAEGVELMFG
jgi:hypothetical protein